MCKASRRDKINRRVRKKGKNTEKAKNSCRKGTGSEKFKKKEILGNQKYKNS